MRPHRAGWDFSACRLRPDRDRGGHRPRARHQSSADMSDRLQAHALRRLRRQCRARPARTEEDEFAVGAEDRLVILALRIEPEFQHSSRAMEGAGHATVTLQLANVAQIDEGHAVPTVKLDGLRRRHRLDLAFCSGNKVISMHRDVLGHCVCQFVRHLTSITHHTANRIAWPVPIRSRPRYSATQTQREGSYATARLCRGDRRCGMAAQGAGAAAHAAGGGGVSDRLNRKCRPAEQRLVLHRPRRTRVRRGAERRHSLPES